MLPDQPIPGALLHGRVGRPGPRCAIPSPERPRNGQRGRLAEVPRGSHEAVITEIEEEVGDRENPAGCRTTAETRAGDELPHQLELDLDAARVAAKPRVAAGRQPGRINGLTSARFARSAASPSSGVTCIPDRSQVGERQRRAIDRVKRCLAGLLAWVRVGVERCNGSGPGRSGAELSRADREASVAVERMRSIGDVDERSIQAESWSCATGRSRSARSSKAAAAARPDRAKHDPESAGVSVSTAGWWDGVGMRAGNRHVQRDR